MKMVDIDSLNPSTYNPRAADPRRLDLIELSLRKLGFVLPIYATPDGEIISGHQRHHVAKRMGVRQVPVAITKAMELPERKAVNVAFNRATNDLDCGDTPKNITEALARVDLDSLANAIPDKTPDTPEFYPCMKAQDMPLAPLLKANSGRWIMSKKKKIKRDDVVNIRLTESEKAEAETLAEMLGFKTVSEYFRHMHEQAVKLNNESNKDKLSALEFEAKARIYHKTKHGKIYHGDSLYLLHKILEPQSVDLIVTSPPFGLTRPKAYGNKTEEQYLRWFRGFAEGFKRVLKPTGSLVIDIGGAWTKGEPSRSLYHFDLLTMLCREFGFHLAQEHYWWNPSKLPTPVEWVNVKRCRVKDAINCIWWLSPTPRPKADNTKILAPYSDSMKKLLKDGYNQSLRPSGHDISDKWKKDNGGAVPPNLLALANTESNSVYSQYCRDKNLTIHPARFPTGLPEYFIRFLTDPGDVVLDPFGGSCVTGEVAEKLERKWICCEMLEPYLEGAIGRFLPQENAPGRKRIKPYEIHPPCALEMA